MDWDTFLAEATEVFVAKNTDYDSRFTRALVQYRKERGYEAARTIWAWEVEKKLDRCRTWITRGELQVNGEGVRNSVVDLFNYTVQWCIFNNSILQGVDPFLQLTERLFYGAAAKFKPEDWVEYLAHEGLIHLNEGELRTLLLKEMAGN